MKVVLFCHSILSDWNHGNAHFLRGVVSELGRRGHAVHVFEPIDAWSAENLVADAGERALYDSLRHYPPFELTRYRLSMLDLDAVLEGAGLVLVHEWNSHELVRRIGRHRARGARYRVLFHDTHHRLVSAPEEMKAYELDAYDGVLAFGEVLRRLYCDRGWGSRAFTWHEAADPFVFRPLSAEPEGDLVWIGNWGDDERTRELAEFLLEPSMRLGLVTRVHGVRYPEAARNSLAHARIQYAGWLPNYRAPDVFAKFRVTVHVPRRAYVEALPGIPTIRPFEALACGIPLVSAPFRDDEGLFRVGDDFLMARDGREMQGMLRAVLEDRALARTLRENGLETIARRHTCAHRVDELLTICRALGVDARAASEQAEVRRAGAPRRAEGGDVGRGTERAHEITEGRP